MRRPLPLRHISALLAIVALTGVAGVSAQPVAKRTLRVSTDGNGSVTTADGRLNCGTRCSAQYRRGKLVTLRALPNRFFAFDRWTGGCVGTAPLCVVALDRPTSARAAFVQKVGSVLMTVGGPGTIVGSSGGLACGKEGTACGQTFPAGTTVTLNPIPAAGGTFAAWGGACSGAGQGPCTVVVDESVEVLAAFRHDDPDPDKPQLTVIPEGLHVTSDPPGIDCPSTCQAEFTSGTLVTLRGGSGHWNGACVGSVSSCLLVVDVSDGTGTGGPPPPPPPPLLGVNVSVSGRGVVSATGRTRIRCGKKDETLFDCEGLFPQGSSLLLRATPGRKNRFARWGGFCRGKKRTCTLLVTAPKTVQALFRR